MVPNKWALVLYAVLLLFLFLAWYRVDFVILLQEAQGAIQEQRELRSKVHLAAKAQKVARDMEHDYEEVVRLLEGEIAQLKLQLGRQSVRLL